MNSRRLRADQGKRAEDSQPDGRAEELMLRRGLIDPAERRGLVWPVTLDALVALAMPPPLASYVRWRRRPVTIARMPVSRSWRFSATVSAACRHTVQVRT